jgi:hypothetical protein
MISENVVMSAKVATSGKYAKMTAFVLAFIGEGRRWRGRHQNKAIACPIWNNQSERPYGSSSCSRPIVTSHTKQLPFLANALSGVEWPTLFSDKKESWIGLEFGLSWGSHEGISRALNCQGSQPIHLNGKLRSILLFCIHPSRETVSCGVLRFQSGSIQVF